MDGIENGKNGRATLSVTRPPQGGSFVSINLATWKMVLAIIVSGAALFGALVTFAERFAQPAIDARIDAKDGWLREKALHIEKVVEESNLERTRDHARYDQALVTAERDRKEILDSLKEIDRKLDRRNGDGR